MFGFIRKKKVFNIIDKEILGVSNKILRISNEIVRLESLENIDVMVKITLLETKEMLLETKERLEDIKVRCIFTRLH